MEIYGYKFAPDAVLQTVGSIVGSLIGAFLAGLVAILVMKLQFRNEKKNEHIERLRNFSKAFNAIQLSGVVIIELMRMDLKFIQKLSSNFKLGILPVDKEWEVKIDSAIKNTLAKLETEYESIANINQDHIPHGDTFLSFLSVKKTIKSYISISKSIDISLFNSRGVDEHLKSLEEMKEHFQNVFKKFQDLSIEKELELKRLDGKGMNYLIKEENKILKKLKDFTAKLNFLKKTP